MAIIAVAGRKGGIGKSTIAGNLAAELVRMGRSVIALDADPQHSLAIWAEHGEGVLSRCVERVADIKTLRAGAHAAEKHVDVVVIDTPPGMPETTYQSALAADLMLLPCGPSPLDLFALREALSLSLKARAERRSKKPRIRFVPSKVVMSSNLSRGLEEALKDMGKKVLPAIAQRVVVAEAVASGLSVSEYAPHSPAHDEFRALAKAVEKVLKR